MKSNIILIKSFVSMVLQSNLDQTKSSKTLYSFDEKLVFARMSNRAREIVTLQIGHYANHVGTHFWNAQEALFDYSPSPRVSKRYYFTFYHAFKIRLFERYLFPCFYFVFLHFRDCFFLFLKSIFFETFRLSSEDSYSYIFYNKKMNRRVK